jgi:hypothetical protein
MEGQGGGEAQGVADPPKSINEKNFLFLILLMLRIVNVLKLNMHMLGYNLPLLTFDHYIFSFKSDYSLLTKCQFCDVDNMSCLLLCQH